jgi:hypothetical protein
MTLRKAIWFSFSAFNPKSLGVYAAVIALMAFAGSWAHAGDIIYGPDIHDNGGADYSGFNTGSFTYPQFDPLGGLRALTKVTLTVQVATVGGEHAFDNESGAGATITLGIGSQVRIKGPLPGIGAQLIVNPDATQTVTNSVDPDNEPFSGAADFAGTDYLSIIGSVTSDTRSGFKTSLFDLAPYIGTGTASFDFDGSTSTTGTSALPSPGANLVTAPHWFFYTTLDYEFTEVPEPASLTILLLGAPLVLRRALKRH